jgi:hypothetical protein
MQKKIYIISLIILFTTSSYALTRGDVQIIEARENIQYLGQKITTDYFLLYKRPNDLSLKNKFQENIKEIEKNIQNIRDTTQNHITINILNFYDYRLEYIKKLPLQEPTHQDARIILDASRYFLEGARSISEQHHYKSSKEESMLVHCKELKYLVESVSKYYMAFQIGLRESNYDVKMQQAMRDINRNLNNISDYHYPYRLQNKLQKIKNIWEHNQTFFENLKETTYTNLLLSSNEYLKTLLVELEKYHKQNL